MVFQFHGRRAGRAEGAGGDGSGKLVLLSNLLTVRRLWAGTPRGINLGQQLASCEQTQVLTGCCPVCKYQYNMQSTSSSFHSVSLPLPIPPPSPWLSLQEQPLVCLSEEDRTGGPWLSRQDTWFLTGMQKTLCPQGISLGQSHNPCDSVPVLCFTASHAFPYPYWLPWLPCPISPSNQASSLRLGSIIFASAPVEGQGHVPSEIRWNLWVSIFLLSTPQNGKGVFHFLLFWV